jgi:hypothetical protein
LKPLSFASFGYPENFSDFGSKKDSVPLISYCCTKSLRDGYVAHEPCHAWQGALARRMGRVSKTGAMEAAHLTYSAIRHTIMQWQPWAKAFFSGGFDAAGRQK